MFSSASSTYSLKRPARCIASLASRESGDEQQHDTPRFVVGTCTLREPNELHVLGFHEESNELLCDQAFLHPNEVWDVSPSPTDPSLLLTCSNGTKAGESLSGNGDFKVSLWKLPQLYPSQDPSQELTLGGARVPPSDKLGKPQWEVGGLHAAATAMLWNPAGAGLSKGENVVTLADGKLMRWALDSGSSEEVGSADVCQATGVVAARNAPAASWDPHRTTEVATAIGCSLKCWDLRTMTVTTTIADAHRYAVRDVDYNPNKPFCIVTCGEDRLIKFWDLRSLDAPIKSMVGHDHWVHTVKYNRFHDQLLISGSSDCMVHLWRVSSVSSAPLLEPEDDDTEGLDGDGVGVGFGISNGSKGEAADIRVRTFDEHEESVYSVSWSTSDAWILASLSYDGQVVLNHVPSTEKYKILL